MTRLEKLRQELQESRARTEAARLSLEHVQARVALKRQFLARTRVALDTHKGAANDFENNYGR